MSNGDIEVKKGRLATVGFLVIALLVGVGWLSTHITGFNLNRLMNMFKGEGAISASTNDAPMPGGGNSATSPAPVKYQAQAAPASAPAPMAVRENAASPLRVCIVDWPGYMGGQLFNEGFEASTKSRYYKEYKLLVEFKLIPEFTDSRDTWKAGGCDLLWGTADSFGTESGALVRAGYSPKIGFFSDFSRGGDNAVGLPGIKNICDMGKPGVKVGAAQGSPSHSFLLYSAKACGLRPDQIDYVPFNKPEEVRDALLAGQIQIGILWSPMELDVQRGRPGSKVLASTKEADHIIADIFFYNEEVGRARHEDIVNLVEGWLIGAEEINNDPHARQRAAQINADGVGRPVEDILATIDNVRLVTFGDNMLFFGLTRAADSVTGERLYTETAQLYQQYYPQLMESKPASWSTIVDLSILREIRNRGKLSPQEVEPAPVFKPVTPEIAAQPAITQKPLAVQFPTGSSLLDINAQNMIDTQFIPDARRFQNVYIRVEGNTDNTGSDATNDRLSRERAEAVKQFLVSRGISAARIIVQGNGSRNPVNPNADNNAPENRAANRRTEFQFLKNG